MIRSRLDCPRGGVALAGNIHLRRLDCDWRVDFPFHLSGNNTQFANRTGILSFSKYRNLAGEPDDRNQVVWPQL
jgi:hypothetical protein